MFNSRNIEELKYAKEKAEEGDQLKSSFLANMSHEVRTPMNGIIGFAQFLKDPELTNENRIRYINIINDSCQQLLSIIEDILEVSKIETGQIEIMNEEFDARELVNDAFISHKDICEQKGIKFENKNLLRGDCIIYSDKIKWRQVINNLLNNALKFTHEGNIEIGAKGNNDHIEIYVKDTGIGIENEIKEKIFERFRQAENAIARTYGGTGLGLAIAKGYVELLNGKIWVDSEVGKGSTFSFRIPRNNGKSYLKTLENDNTDILEPIINFKDAAILVAEDEEINFQYMKRVLNGVGITKVIRARNGKEAIDSINNIGSVNLIMMDLKMPVINGFEAARKIKSINPKIPIIAQTALAIQGDREKALDAGCDDYIAKPINLDDLLDLLKKYIIF